MIINLWTAIIIFMYLPPYELIITCCLGRTLFAGTKSKHSHFGIFSATGVAVYFHNNQGKITLQRHTMYHPSKGEGETAILRYHAPPSWIACRTNTRLDGHVGPHVCFVNMAKGLLSAVWSKSCKGIPYFDSSFIAKWLEKDGKVPKKVITRG